MNARKKRAETSRRGKPKVLYVITRAEYGGAQTHVFRLALGLKSKFEIEVATGEEGFLTSTCRAENIPVHVIPHLQREIRPFRDLRAFCELYALMRRLRPDLVHAHTFKAGLLGRLAARALNIPSVYTLHSWLFDTAAMPRRWGLFASPCEWLGAILCDRVITISDEGERLLRTHVSASRSKVVTIRNGIPDDSQKIRCSSDRALRIIMVARFTKVKEFDVLLRAFARIKTGPRLILVGNGVTQGECESLSRKLGLTGRVEFLGSRDDVPALLADSDIFVLASKYEMSPISILEAMRAGLPVIASDVGGVAEMLGRNGLLVPSGSVDDLAATLSSLIEDKELRLRLGRAARLRFERHYDFVKQLELTSALYKEIVFAEKSMPLDSHSRFRAIPQTQDLTATHPIKTAPGEQELAA